MIITTWRVMRGRSLSGPSAPGSLNSAQNSLPRRSSRIGSPWTSSTSTPSKSASTVSGVATWVIVRWYEPYHVSYWEGWQALHVADDTNPSVGAWIGRLAT